MDTLGGFSLQDLKILYGIVSKALPKRNGKVVEFNPLLTSVLGCNSNVLHLGSKEQSKAALFYIGPYINKGGVKITDALPILDKAREHAIQYPSIADDVNTAPTKRYLQQVLTRLLNKLNSLIEVSDTQVASYLLGMGTSLCSETFVACDTTAYQKFVKDEIQRLMKSGVDEGSDEDINSDEEYEYYDEIDILRDDGNNSMGLAESSLEGDDASQDGHSVSDTTADPMDEEGEDLGSSNIDEDFKHINASYGRTAPLYLSNSGKSKIPVSYAALYRYRGESLKHLNRYEYNALIRVEKKADDEGPKKAGRKKNLSFQFAPGLDIDKNYHQVLNSKLLTPKFSRSPPSPPTAKPQPPDLEESDTGYEDQYKAWRRKADCFAHFYLTMFRPETELYEKGQANSYKYNWESFEEYYDQICWSRYEIDELRYSQIDRMIHSWRVDRDKKEMLTAFRGRERTMWTAEEKAVRNEYFNSSSHKPIIGDDGMDYISDLVQEYLTPEEFDNARKHLGHSNAILNTLGNLTKTSHLHTSCESSSNASKSRRSHVANVVTLPFDMDLDEAKRKSQVKDTTVANSSSTPSMYRTVSNLDRKVKDYIKSQDLSADKDSVIKIAVDHFNAIRSGRARDKNYEAPNVLVCGKPGNGKSKIIESLDGIVEIMKVGEQMKNAYLGSAAVGIRGTTLLKSWNIPVFNKGQTVTYRPWNEDSLLALKRRFGQNVDNICAVIIDEISTVQPYMLAYLNARMQELFNNNKPFGGRMVILFGDFDQKPPTAGDTFPGVVMQHIEAKGKPLTSKSADKLSLAQMGGYLFTKFRYIKLTTQHRSGDQKHTDVINKMSDTGMLTVEDLKNTYKKLSSEDLDSDGFRFATTIVTGNAERREINAWQSKRWAEYYGVNTVLWLRKREDASWKGKPRTDESIAHAMKNNCFKEYFPPGAKGYLNSYGINADEGLANGTEIRYHSLSFEDKKQKKRFNKLLRQAKPGDVIDLDFPPTAINVELFADFEGDSDAVKADNVSKRKSWFDSGKQSITRDERVVIPISIRDGNKISTRATSYIPGSGLNQGTIYYHNSRLNMRDHFPIEPAFSITVDKAQVCNVHMCAYFIIYPKYSSDLTLLSLQYAFRERPSIELYYPSRNMNITSTR